MLCMIPLYWWTWPTTSKSFITWYLHLDFWILLHFCQSAYTKMPTLVHMCRGEVLTPNESRFLPHQSHISGSPWFVPAPFLLGKCGVWLGAPQAIVECCFRKLCLSPVPCLWSPHWLMDTISLAPLLLSSETVNVDRHWCCPTRLQLWTTVMGTSSLSFISIL